MTPNAGPVLALPAAIGLLDAIEDIDPAEIVERLVRAHGHGVILAALGQSSPPDAVATTPAQIAALSAEQLAAHNPACRRLALNANRADLSMTRLQMEASAARKPRRTVRLKPVAALCKAAQPHAPSKQLFYVWQKQAQKLGLGITRPGKRNGVLMDEAFGKRKLARWRLANPNGARKNRKRKPG
jgi:hypothetical protein